MGTPLSSLPCCCLTVCCSWGVYILSSSPSQGGWAWSSLSVRRLPSTGGLSPNVSVVSSSTLSSSITAAASTPLWPFSSFWGWGRYQVPAVSLPPYFRVEPCLWPYPLSSCCLKWAPSPPLPFMMPWFPVCFSSAPTICAGTQFADDPDRWTCNTLPAPRMILALCILPPLHANGYVGPVTCLRHLVHWKPDSDRHLAIFPVEYHVFHQTHPEPFSRSCFPLRLVRSPPSLSHS